MDTLNLARGIAPQLVEWRRTLHRWPELSLQEHKTCALITTALSEMGIDHRVAGETGVLGLIGGGLVKEGQPGPVIALRADMDALPLQEESGVEYSSQRPGIMHACGHDAHVAMLLGAAKLLSELAPQLSGSVRLIFQPSEEHHPGGALTMIKEGALTQPQVDMVLGLHVEPLLHKGQLGLRAGEMWASADNFRLLIQGKGGHGASPHLTIDPIVLAARVVLDMQTLVSRRVSPVEPAVITFGAINGGRKTNIIPGEVELLGTVRTLNSDLRRQIPEWMRDLVQGITEPAGGSYQLDYHFGYPPVNNHSQAVSLVEQAGIKVLGEQGIIRLKHPLMGAEDFAYYGEQVPACMATLGIGQEGETPIPWHSPRFRVDEEALPLGVAVLVQSVLDFFQTAV